MTIPFKNAKLNFQIFIVNYTGSSAAWLARNVRDVEVEGSNPSSPITYFMVQAHIFFSGTVQGVGFRFAVQRYARDLGLTGWVRNLSDGRVEVLAQGEKKKLERLICSVEDYFEGYIADKEIDFNDANSEFKDFRISF